MPSCPRPPPFRIGFAWGPECRRHTAPRSRRALTLPRLPRSPSWPGKAPTPRRWTRHLVRAARSEFSAPAIRPRPPSRSCRPTQLPICAAAAGWRPRRRRAATASQPLGSAAAPCQERAGGLRKAHTAPRPAGETRRQAPAGGRARRAGEAARVAAAAQGQGRPALDHGAAVQRRRAAGGRLLARADEPARHGELVCCGRRPTHAAVGTRRRRRSQGQRRGRAHAGAPGARRGRPGACRHPRRCVLPRRRPGAGRAEPGLAAAGRQGRAAARAHAARPALRLAGAGAVAWRAAHAPLGR